MLYNKPTLRFRILHVKFMLLEGSDFLFCDTLYFGRLDQFLEESDAFIFRVENGGSRVQHNVANYPPDYTMSRPRSL